MTSERSGIAEYQAPAFRLDLPCPRCGNPTLIGYSFRDQNGDHQHTHYVCTFWRSSSGERTAQCGWHDWTVPGA